MCREIAGKGKENKDARKECMRESFKEECKEECTFQAPNKACRTCKEALTKDKKKEMRQFCSETAGKGKENKDARKQCMRESKKAECEEECTSEPGLLLEESDEGDETTKLIPWQWRGIMFWQGGIN